jgi:hypothetical protein
MPPGGPPPPAGNWADPVLFTSASGFNLNSQFTHPTLAEIDNRLTVRARRWEALKRLRVLRLRLAPPPVLARADIHLAFPQNYYDIWADPRLSTVLTRANVVTISSMPEHLDLDWFGDPNVNWWGGGVNGAAYHLQVAEQLQYLLENSFGLGNSQNAGKTSADPQYWTWPPGIKFPTWQLDLKLQPVPPGTSAGPVMTLEWYVDNTSGPATPTVVTNGNVMRMTSRMPAQRNGIQLI